MLVALVLVLTTGLSLCVVTDAQTRAAATASNVAAQDPLIMLPASDAVVTADVKRLLNEALPRAFAADQAKLTQINADIDRLKTRTGVDLRSVEKIALGVKFRDLTTAAAQKKSAETGQNGVVAAGQPTKGEMVAIARGTFQDAPIVAAGRLAAKDKYRTEKYAGKNIYVFTLNERMKLFGLFDTRVSDVAVCVLDARTLAVGQLSRVREAIDAATGRGRVGAELVGLATRKPDAILGFGANVPPAALRELGVLGLDSDEITKNVASIRQVYGSIGMTANGFDMQATARTESAQAAKGLNDTLLAAKEVVAPLVSQFLRNEAKARFVRNALDSLKVAATGNELQIQLEVAQSDLSTLVSGI